MSGKPYPEQPELQTVAPFRASRLTLPGNFREALRQAWNDPSKVLFGVGQGIPSVFLTKVGVSQVPMRCFGAKPIARSMPRSSPITFGSMSSTPCSTG